MLLEVCANSIQSAINAELGGADRIELCRNLAVGGTTPTLEELKEVKRKVSIPIFVLVRSRGGNFVYNTHELEEMEESIRVCKQLGYEGVVIGALTVDNRVDTEAVKRLIAAADGMKVTFHKAFDEVEDYIEALKHVKALGCNRILTSGLSDTAMGGIDVLKELVRESAEEIIIMPGGSVRPENIQKLKATLASEFHSSCIPIGSNETEVAMVKLLKSKFF